MLNYSSTETYVPFETLVSFFAKVARDYKIYPSRIQRRGVVVTGDKKKKQEITTLFVCSEPIIPRGVNMDFPLLFATMV